ncbi:hypothetical protein HYX18_03770 [Candidatus Woesearchaeota archaeon]|nr:hypothetical protein [Candidatus Woesearchaeota archaeon]
MLDTKTIRIIISKNEKNKLQKSAIKDGFENISNYIRYKLIKDAVIKNKIKNLYCVLKEKNG